MAAHNKIRNTFVLNKVELNKYNNAEADMAKREFRGFCWVGFRFR